jgi:phosphatidylglycerol:prolipoprotein diacylglycerol transferase
VAILAGGVGAKLYYMALHRRERRFEGWCLQGFLLSTVATLIVGLVVAQVPVRPFLDAAAPGLLMGMAVGRLGCFFAGCCMGRPTASRWGIWSSDRRVGTRRIPTQLLESGLALAIGLITLVVVLSYQPPVAGALFLASISAYTILRQGVLLLRAERRRTSYAGAITSAVAGAALLASVLVLALA